MASSDYFLLIEGIKGESHDKLMATKGAIDIESWSGGEAQPCFNEAGGQGAGKVTGQDFHFVSRVSKATPALILACANGQPLKKVELIVRKAGKTP